MYNESYIGNAIKDRRKSLGMSQTELAQKVIGENAAHKSVSDWERNEVTPETKTLISICNALDCDIDYLLGSIKEYRRTTHDIVELTGLSAEASNELMYHKEDGHNKGLEILSKLLTSRKFWAVLAYINMAQYAETGIKKPMSDTLQEQVLYLEMVNMVERHPGATIPTAEQVRDMNLYHASQKFSECISEIVGEMAK